ncbi:hypothetical protein BT96DRAFT_1063148, partial [Gymnopus androsaceus JB14]
IRGLSFAIINSTTIALPAWRDACASHHLKSILLPHDVATCWNSTFDTLVVARKYSAVIDSVTGNKSLKLRRFELSDPQWKIVNDLIFVLNIFKKATLKFSMDSESTILQVIPMMDVINDFLSQNPKRDLHAAVKASLKLAQATLNCYYS